MAGLTNAESVATLDARFPSRPTTCASSRPSSRSPSSVADCAPSAAALTPADRYRCAVCAAVYVVPSLARLCEARHSQEHP